jgi:hypothetical protein
MGSTLVGKASQGPAHYADGYQFGRVAVGPATTYNNIIKTIQAHSRIRP